MESRQIIKEPIVTEKATRLREKDNKYVFVVDKKATKAQIKSAIEELFKVKVQDVHTAICRGKLRRMGVYSGYQPEWKKAIVKLQKGQEIKLVEGT